jgi:hypothetical protein
MTAVQQVFSDLEKLQPHLFNMHSVEGREFVNHFHKYLDIEKQQIIDAYESLEHRHGENYYNETYKNSEQ